MKDVRTASHLLNLFGIFRRNLRTLPRAGTAALLLLVGGVARADEDGTTFFAIADPQINIPRWGTAGTEKTIEIMNALPGEPFPLGGTVGEPVGVISAGDLVDDMSHPANWQLYKKLFDPRGDARLRFPVFEGIGNHDLLSEQAAGEFNWLQKEFIERNRQRPGEFDFGPNDYHYAWEWHGVRFIQLNLFPGYTHRPVYGNLRPWNDPKNSLAFLKENLAERVGDSGQPVVLVWHYGLRGWGLEKWWTEEDLDNLAETLEDYNVVLILHGHEHRFERYKWEGYDVIMVPSPQYDRDPEQPETESRPKGFLVFRITDDELRMGHHTADGWADTWSTKLDQG